jgi:hypothetical protein
MTLLSCKIFPGGFSGEVSFKINQDYGSEHVGLAARQYFWDTRGQPITQPPAQGIDGFVVVRVLDEEPNKESILVSVPDGDVIKTKKSHIFISRPQPETQPHVPVGS